jgi:hypothetical protein
MRVLVTWGSKRGGTAGIGRVLGDALGSYGFEIVAVPPREVEGRGTFGAVIVGGALYATADRARCGASSAATWPTSARCCHVARGTAA